MDMYINLFFIFQFTYGSQYYFSNAEPLVGPGVRLAGRNEFPFIVAIRTSSDVTVHGHFCSGTLISRRHVLTSEHCLDDETLETLQVTIGSADMRSGQHFSVSSWISYDDWVYENYQSPNDKDNDIAIATLIRIVDDPRIIPARISPLNSFSLAGTYLTIAGWGQLEYGSQPRSLQTAQVYVYSNWQCIDIMSRLQDRRKALSAVYICTRAIPAAFTSCGDSGGPLLTSDHEIVGVIDSGCSDVLRDEDKVDFHLSIHDYRGFITDVLHQQRHLL